MQNYALSSRVAIILRQPSAPSVARRNRGAAEAVKPELVKGELAQ